MDVPLTDVQVQILQGLEARCVTANRDREVALAMALAGAGIPTAQVVGFDFAAKVVRVKLPDAAPEEDPSKPRLVPEPQEQAS